MYICSTKIVIMNQIGIYKITSPNGRVYIGQSINIKKRFKSYLNLNVGNKSQTLLYRSLLKYGPENHSFEILVECHLEELNDYERYYQDLYNVCDVRSGLNCRLTSTNDRSPFFSETTKEKMRKNAKVRQYSDATRFKMSESAKKRKPQKREPYNLKPLEERTNVKVKSLSQILEFKKLNDSGVSTELIGKMFSINGSTVRKHLRKLRIKGFPLPEAVKPKNK